MNAQAKNGTKLATILASMVMFAGPAMAWDNPYYYGNYGGHG